MPHMTPIMPKPICIPRILASNTLKSHMDDIATTIVNLTSPELFRIFGVVKDDGQNIVDHTMYSIIILYDSEAVSGEKEYIEIMGFRNTTINTPITLMEM